MRTPRGTYDLYGERAELYEYLFDTFRKYARLNGFSPIYTPVIEFFSLFAKKSGEEILRSMYVFEDKAGRRLALRPEVTAPIIRAYLSHMRGWSKPISLYYIARCYRYEEPQRGRNREFWQAGLEVIGDKSIVADIRVAVTLHDYLEELGISHVFQVGNVAIYRYVMEQHGVPREKQDHILHLIDKNMVRDAVEEAAKYSGELASLIEEITRADIGVLETIIASHIGREHAKAIHEHIEKTMFFIDTLSEIGINAVYNPSLVRGLAYYTGLIYEIKTPLLDTSIGGGGRYNNLTRVYGGPEEASTGAALGLDRIALAMEETGISISNGDKNHVYIVLLNTSRSCIAVAEKLRRTLVDHGVRVTMIYGRKLKKTLSRISDKAAVAVFVGEREAAQGKITYKFMATGEQCSSDINAAVRDIVDYIMSNTTKSHPLSHDTGAS